MATFEDFKKLELRIATVVEAKPHPNADRLYVLDVLIGDTKKQLVAGIRPYYTVEALVGKKIVVVNNLEPAVIRGVESQGMLLAASNENEVVILTPEKDILSGSVVR